MRQWQLVCCLIPASLHEPLRQWTLNHQRATLAGDRARLAAVAIEFDGYIRTLLAERRALGVEAPDDLTTVLLREWVSGRPLSDEELVSLLRNWTVGERISIIWASANRDEAVFGNPDESRSGPVTRAADSAPFGAGWNKPLRATGAGGYCCGGSWRTTLTLCCSLVHLPWGLSMYWKYSLVKLPWLQV